MYGGTVNYGGTAIRNVYVIFFEFAIHGEFYYVIVSEFGTNGTEYELRMWNAQGRPCKSIEGYIYIGTHGTEYELNMWNM